MFVKGLVLTYLHIVVFTSCIASSNGQLNWSYLNNPEFEKIGKLVLEGEVDPHYEIIRRELVSSFLESLEVCQNGLDETARKIDSLLDSYDSVEDEIDEPTDVMQREPFHDFELIEEDLSDVFNDRMNWGKTRPALAVRDFQRILRAVRHACTVLPTSIPPVSIRRKRSPEKVVRGVAFSLTKWSERWVNSIENKLSTFMTDCLDEDDCKSYLENIVKSLIEITKDSESGAVKDTSHILNEILQNISYKTSPSLETLSYVQRAALNLGNTLDGNKQDEENAYRLAENIFHQNKHLLPKGDGNGAEKLYILSNLMKFNPTEVLAPDNVPQIRIETDQTVTVVPETFLSLAIGSRLIRDGWGELREKFPKFLRLASNLSPSFFRVGGSHSNFLNYDPTTTTEDSPGPRNSPIDKGVSSRNRKYRNIGPNHPKLRKEREVVEVNAIPRSSNHPKSRSRVDHAIDTPERQEYKVAGSGEEAEEDRCDRQLDQNEFENFTMSEGDWRVLVDLVRDLNWTLLFDLNQFWRTPSGAWDPTNAKLLIDDPYSSKIPIIWQLGNEPNSYWHKFEWRISPEEEAKDYERLRQVVGNDVTIVGPDVTRPKHVTPSDDLQEDSMEFLEGFLKAGNKYIDTVTWHQYYVNGRTTTLDEFLSPKTLDEFPKQLLKLVAVRDELAKGKPVWLTETASAWGGGAPQISNRFAGAIPWLDKLGAAALGGVSLVFRQTLYGGCYALIAPNLTPYPDFWLSVIYKHVVGNGVLLPRVTQAPDSLRIYSHCLNNKHPLFKKGAIVVFGINLSEFGQYASLRGKDLEKSVKFLYQISPPQGDLKSRDVWLNGQTLRAKKDGSLPPLSPIPDTAEGLNFPPWTMSFWVFPDAQAKAC